MLLSGGRPPQILPHNLTTKKGSRQTTGFPKNKKSARRGSNPRPPPWQGGAPPLSHSRIIQILNLPLLIRIAPTNISISDFNICVNLFLQISCNFSATFVISSPANHKINRSLYHQKSAKNRPPCESCEKITPFTRQSFSFN